MRHPRRADFMAIFLCSTAGAPGAFADTCTPPPPADTTSSLSVTCRADAQPDSQSFQFGSGTQLIDIQTGTFDLVWGGDDADRLTANGGSVDWLNGQRGADNLIVNGGTHGRITGGDGNDIIELNGGTVRTVEGDGGNDTVVLDGTVTVTNRLDGNAGRDTLALRGTGTLDGSIVFAFEDLELRTGANWTYGARGTSFEVVGLNSGSSFAIPAGRLLTTGDFFVEPSATLTVDGDIQIAPGAFGVFLEGALTGSGRVERTGGINVFDVQPTAVIRPGSSIGQLDIENVDLFISPGARLVAEVDPLGTPNADLLNVTGRVNDVDNLTIEVESLAPGATPADYVAGNTYTVLRAGTLDGDSPAIVEGASLPALVDVAIVGSPSATGEVRLRFTEVPVTQLPQRPAVVATGSPNTTNLVTAVAQTTTAQPPTSGGTPPPTTGGQTPVVLVNSTPLRQAVSRLSNEDLTRFGGVHAEPYSSNLTIGLEQHDLIANMALDHASGLGFPIADDAFASIAGSTLDPELAFDNRVWVNVAGVRGSVEGENGLGNFDYEIDTVAVGSDLIRAPDYTIGYFTTVGRSKMSEHDEVDQEFTTETVGIGAYGRYRFPQGLHLSGVAGITYGRTDAVRENPDIGDFTGGDAESEFDSHGIFAGLKLHQTFEVGGARLTPSGGMTYARIRQEEARESGGGDFDYVIDEAEAESFVTLVGLDISYPIIRGDNVFAPVAFARYDFDWLADRDEDHEINVTSPIFGSFDQVGQNRGPEGFGLGAGFTYERGDLFDVGLGYLYSERSNGKEHSVSANLTIQW